MVLDEAFLDKQLDLAKESARLRTAYDLRTSLSDGSQRVLNALWLGTSIPIHRHRTTAETVVVLRGSMTEIFYDNDGVECGRYLLDPTKGSYGLQIPMNQWHTVIVHEPTVILEAKDGPYEPLSAEDTWSRE